MLKSCCEWLPLNCYWACDVVCLVYRYCRVYEQCWVCMVYVEVQVMLWTSVAAEPVTYGLPYMQRAVEWAVLSVLLHYSYPFLKWVWIGQCAFCGVHSWQNGTKCTRVNYCGVIPIQLGWFLRVSYLHALVFSPKTLLWLVSVVFFW